MEKVGSCRFELAGTLIGVAAEFRCIIVGRGELVAEIRDDT